MSIRINDLTVRFKNGVVAVNKASLEIPKGIYGLLGENGAGKTTLMRVLTTVLKQTEGMVSLDGILYNEGNYEKIQKKIGYLPQEIDLYPNLTVKECLVYMGGLAGWISSICFLLAQHPCHFKSLMTSNKELPIIWKRLLLQSIRIKKCGNYLVV